MGKWCIAIMLLLLLQGCLFVDPKGVADFEPMSKLLQNPTADSLEQKRQYSQNSVCLVSPEMRIKLELLRRNRNRKLIVAINNKQWKTLRALLPNFYEDYGGIERFCAISELDKQLLLDFVEGQRDILYPITLEKLMVVLRG